MILVLKTVLWSCSVWDWIYLSNYCIPCF